MRKKKSYEYFILLSLPGCISFYRRHQLVSSTSGLVYFTRTLALVKTSSAALAFAHACCSTGFPSHFSQEVFPFLHSSACSYARLAGLAATLCACKLIAVLSLCVQSGRQEFNFTVLIFCLPLQYLAHARITTVAIQEFETDLWTILSCANIVPNAIHA